jgi:hypothetical protein
MKLKTLSLLISVIAINLVNAGPTIAKKVVFDAVGLPQELIPLKMDTPKAKYVVMINSEGEIRDILCSEATHYELVEYGEAVIRKKEWALPENAEVPDRHTFRVELTFVDYEQLSWKQSDGRFIPQGGSSIDGVAARMYRTSPGMYVYEKSDAKDLDKPIELVEGGIIIAEDLNGQPASGKATVEFYVGPEGKTHFPSFLETDSNLVTESVIRTLEKFRFTPPKRNSRPTFVLVKQEFSFN